MSTTAVTPAAVKTKTTFWHKVEAALKKIFGSSTWEQTAISVLTYAGPILQTVVALAAGGPAEALVAAAIATAKSDLGVAAAIVNGVTSTPAPNEVALFVNSMNSIKSNLTGLLTAAEVKNSGKQAEITSAVNLIVDEIDACVAHAPATQS
jgi:hypothetical protein